MELLLSRKGKFMSLGVSNPGGIDHYGAQKVKFEDGPSLGDKLAYKIGEHDMQTFPTPVMQSAWDHLIVTLTNTNLFFLKLEGIAPLYYGKTHYEPRVEPWRNERNTRFFIFAKPTRSRFGKVPLHL